MLDTPTLADVSITERNDLQEYISNTPDEFFKEIGQELFLLGKEVEPSKNVQDRIDLLAVDKEGIVIVIELKRSSHKLHMLQAISYAGMIAQWEPDDYLQLLDDDKQEALSDFLEVDHQDINHQHESFWSLRHTTTLCSSAQNGSASNTAWTSPAVVSP